MTSVLAPPYDTIDASLRAALLAADADNIVGVDIPAMPILEQADAAAYDVARTRWDQLLASGRVRPFPDAGVFVGRQTFRGRRGIVHRRAILWAGVPVSRDGDPGILAHEQTHRGARNDRLALLRHAALQTSPIFGMYRDPSGRIEDLLRQVMLTREPLLSGVTSEGTLHEVWDVADSREAAGLIETFGDREIVIVDGHHRFASFCQHLQDAPESHARADHPARCCMFGLVSSHDPGMNVYPVHRVLTGLPSWSMDRFIEASMDVMIVHNVGSDLASLAERVRDNAFEGSHAMGLYDVATGMCYVACTRRPDPLADRFPDASALWRTHDAVVFEHLVLEDVVSQRMNDGQRPQVAACLSEQGFSRDGAALGVLLQASPLETVVQLAADHELLPPETTHFNPKLPTGLLLHPLDELPTEDH